MMNLKFYFIELMNLQLIHIGSAALSTFYLCVTQNWPIVWITKIFSMPKTLLHHIIPIHVHLNTLHILVVNNLRFC